MEDSIKKFTARTRSRKTIMEILQKFIACALVLWCSGILIINPVSAQEAAFPSEPSEGASAGSDLISLDLKGVDILELFKMLSLKTGLNIAPTKNVVGRVNLFINNVSFEDALEIILVSNELAAERRGNIVNIMTGGEYQALYGKRYDEKRKVISLQLNYAPPRSVYTALESLKSDIGRVIVDEASGILILIDIPEKIEEMRKMVEKLDHALVAEIFELNYAKAEDIEAKISKVLTSNVRTIQVDKRTNKIMVADLSEKMDEIRRMINEFDESSRQVLIEMDIWQLSLTERSQRGIEAILLTGSRLVTS